MVFLLIVPSIMLVAIILIHETAKYFGKKISYIPLASCAVLAFAVDFAAAQFSSAADKIYFLKLFILIFVAAAAVTALNRFLEVKR